MNRSQIITDIFEAMGCMHRLMVPPQHSFPKNMPTRAQFGIMIALAHHDMQSVKELATHFSMSSSAVTQLVDTLVEDKLLVRKEDGQDRRKISISLTAKGKKLLLNTQKVRLQSMEKMLHPLSDKELLQWKDLNQKIVQHLQHS